MTPSLEKVVEVNGGSSGFLRTRGLRRGFVRCFNCTGSDRCQVFHCFAHLFTGYVLSEEDAAPQVVDFEVHGKVTPM